MAQVWSAVHQPTRHNVAIKLLRERPRADGSDEQALRNELRAAFRLEHPNIVRVHDFGRTPHALGKPLTPRRPERSGPIGGLEIPGLPASDTAPERKPYAAGLSAGLGEIAPAGAPYMVMEWVAGGTLAPRCGLANWVEIRDVATGLLEALAHAHARSIIHRDLKPLNVLLDRSGRIAKLADFGLASWVSSTEEPSRWATPAFMSPEQVRGQWRDYGPWTDLYALGCTLYTLATGAPPFHGTPTKVRRDHTKTRVPRLQARTRVPAGFESWLRRLLEKSPSLRYRRAADALAALERLENPIWTVGASFGPPADPGSDTLDLSVSDPLPPEVTRPGLLVAPIPAQPQLPGDWRHLEARMPRRPAMGLSLVGLRATPLVGLEQERDALWDALRDSQHHRHTQIVQIRGAEGSGKSALLRWLGTTAHAAGLAVWQAEHFAEPGPGQGPSAMLSAALRLQGLDHEDLVLRLQRLVGGSANSLGDAHALAELIEPWSGEAGVRMASSAERYGVLSKLIEWVATERPVVLIFDDVHWGLDALGFIEHWLSRPRSGAVCIVVAAEQDALDAHLDARIAWSVLTEHSSSRDVQIQPLDRDAQHRLIDQLLVLEPALNRQLRDVSAGDPRVARQLLLYLNEHDALEPSETGFRLGATGALPARMRDVVDARLARAIGHLPAVVLEGLELAAVQGMVVRPPEWKRAVRRAGLATSFTTLEALLDLRLVVAGPDGPRRGWRFAHPMVRRALLARALRGKRLRAHHATWMQVLGESAAAHDYRMQERIVRHAFACGEVDKALDVLVGDTLQAARFASDQAACRRLFRYAMKVIEVAELPASDPRRGRLRMEELWLQRLARRDDVGDALDTLARDADIHDWREVRTEVELFRGIRARAAGSAEQAEQHARLALDLAIAHSHGLLRAKALVQLGDVAMQRGDFDRGAKLLERAIRACTREHYLVGTANAHLRLGQGLLLRGQYLEAASQVEQARALYERLGLRWSAASALNTLGEIHRNLDQLTEAEAAYQQSRQLFEALGSEVYHFPLFNQVVLQVRRGVDAQADLLRCIDFFERRDSKLALLTARTLQLGLHARMGLPFALDTLLEQVHGLDHGSRELAEKLEWAAQQCSRHEHPIAATALYYAAAEQYRWVDDAVSAACVEALVNHSGPVPTPVPPERLQHA